MIHTVGPVWSPVEDRSAVLTSAYRESLRVAEELGARSVAFPAISAGAYGWPIEDAARLAVRAVREHQAQREAQGGQPGQGVEEVRFVLFGPAAYEAFDRALRGRAEPPGNP